MNRKTLYRRIAPLALSALLLSPAASAWVSTVSLPGNSLSMSGSVYGPAPAASTATDASRPQAQPAHAATPERRLASQPDRERPSRAGAVIRAAR